MRVIGSVAFALALVLAPAASVRADEPLGAGLTKSEREYIRAHRQEYLREKLSRTGRGPVPTDILAAGSEHAQLEGVAFAYRQFPDLVTTLAREVAESAKAFIAVGSDADEADARNRLTTAGANMANVVFDRVRVNSIWMRDYGPNVVYTRNGDRVVVDLAYNRPRPLDDAHPTEFAAKRNLPVHAPSLILPGGNLILDGHGVAIMTNMVFSEEEGCDPNLTTAALEQYFKDYFGCPRVILLKAMKQDGTGHADMFCKLLNDNTVMVGQYENPADGAEDNAAILDENAALLVAATNGKGEPFRVIRMPMPAFDNGVTATYTNSLLVNDKVLVPQYGTDMDARALEIYRTALPGAEVIGFDCTQIIRLNGAIHCITHEVNGDPLEVVHTNPQQAVADQPLVLTATIKSQQPLKSVRVFWRSGCADWVTDSMAAEAAAPGQYSVTLGTMPINTTIQYWIETEDVRGMKETFPENAGVENAETIFVDLQRQASLPGPGNLLGLLIR